MNNFATARSILAALDSSTIARLGSTIWNHLPAKQRAQLESVRKLADHSRNYAEYRGRLREAVPPAVPFLGDCLRYLPKRRDVLTYYSGLYLTDLTFCREGNPSYRPAPANPDKTLLNFNKFHKLARIVQGTVSYMFIRNATEHDHRYAAVPRALQSEGDTRGA
jgi:son of sevenless-like protein